MFKNLAQRIVRDVLSIDIKNSEAVELAVYRTEASLDSFAWTLLGVGSACWGYITLMVWLTT